MTAPGSLHKKRVLITGATSGIGLHLSKALAAEGADLVLTGRDLIKLQQLKDEMQRGRSEISIFPADLCNDDDISKLVDSLGVLDGVVFNAGIVDYSPVKLLSRSRLRNIFSINFDANVLLIQKILKSRKLNGGASIVFITSVAAIAGVKGTSLYAASKAALISFAKVLANELAPQRVRVNCLSPGIIQTGLLERSNIGSEGMFPKLATDYPLGLGEPRDISGCVIFLLSDSAGWITGTNMTIDGGYLLR